MKYGLFLIFALGSLVLGDSAAAQKPAFIVGSTAFASFNYDTGALGPLIPLINPHFGQCALTADGTGLYVPRGTYSTPYPQIGLVSTTNGSVTKTFGVESAQVMRKLLLSPDQSSLYAFEAGSGLYRIDLASETVAASVTLPNLILDMALSPDGSTLYVSVVFNGVFALNTSDLSQKWSIAATDGQLTVSPDGSQLFVSLESYNFAVAISTSTQVLTKVPLPESSGEEIYVALRQAGNAGLVFSTSVGYTANFINTATDVVSGTFLPLTSNGYVLAHNREDIPFPPIRFAPDGKSIWFLTICTDSSQCTENSMHLDGYSFPSGGSIASTPLSQGFAFIAMTE